MERTFARFASATARATGSPFAFLICVALVLAWAVTGPLFNFSETWQLVINTGTTIITFLMVFLIQNTQNRDSSAVQVKLDELIKILDKADNSLLDMEELTEDDIAKRKAVYERMAKKERNEVTGEKTA